MIYENLKKKEKEECGRGRKIENGKKMNRGESEKEKKEKY